MLLAFSVMSLVAAYLAYRYVLLVSGIGGDVLHSIDRASEKYLDELSRAPFVFELQTDALLAALVVFVAVWFIYLYYFFYRRNYRSGVEAGSAKWGTSREGGKFRDRKNEDNNIIFTENYGMALSREKFDLDYDRNLNVLVVGGSGSGKTRYYVKPNILQLNSSYFLTDPKGTSLKETGYLLRDHGYSIKSFNTIDFSQSMHYNPLKYVKTDAEILSFVNCLIANTNGDKNDAGDPFWENSERLLYISLIAFMRDWLSDEDYSLSGLLTLLSLAEAKEDDEDFESPLDLLFKQIETGKRYIQTSEEPKSLGEYNEAMRGLRPNVDSSNFEWTDSKFVHKTTGARPAELGGISPDEDFALGNYKAFKTAAGKTLKSIIISCNVRLKPLAIKEIRELITYDEMELDTLGDPNKRTAVFAIMSDTDKTFSFLYAIMMWQAINLLCEKALLDYSGRLPTPVNFILDEFANIGKLPDIEQTIAVVRSRNIFMSIILQSLSQLEERYGDSAATIIDCCDTTVFLGGKSTKTNKELAEMMGKETISQITWNQTKGQNPSYTKNEQTSGRDLLDAAEIGKIRRSNALVLIAGAQPLMDRKYRLEKHKRYKYIDPGHAPIRRGLIREKPKYQEPFDFAAYREQQKPKAA